MYSDCKPFVQCSVEYMAGFLEPAPVVWACSVDNNVHVTVTLQIYAERRAI